MRRSRSTAVAYAFAAVVFSCCLGFQFPPRAQERVPQERPPGAHAQGPGDRQSVDLAKLYDAVVDTIEQKFFDEALLKRLDWRERAKAFRPTVLSAATAEDAFRQINALLSELKTSHTALFAPDDYEYYVLLDVLGPDPSLTDLMSRRFWGSGPYFPGIGIFTREIDGLHFVDGVLEGSPADRAGLKYGDEVLTVDAMPYSPVAAFRGKIGTTVELKIRRDFNATPQSLEVSVIPIRPTSAFAAATAASARIIEQNGSRIGYVHIWSSNEPNTFKAALAKFEPRNIVQDRLRTWGVSIPPNTMRSVVEDAPKPLDFLIVDIRGRVGGNTAVAGQYLELLDAREKPYWGNSRTIVRSNSRLQTGLGNSPQNPPFRGRSTLLIDHQTRSAAEFMAYGYKRGAFGPLIGTTTAGAASSGALFAMPADLLLYVAVAGHELNGERLEGVGVTPDHRVERPLRYAAGADPVLDAAVDLLAKQAPK
jgi:carboxyl-terminal processing protease